MLAIKEALAQSRNLDCLTKTHVITEDASLFILVQVVKPDHSFFLVLEKALVNFCG